MPSPQSFLRSLHIFLTENIGQSSLTLSLLLIGLEVLVESHLSCPCIYCWNTWLIALIFFGPFGFLLLLMCFLLRPCRHKCWCFCCENLSSDEKNYLKALGHCLIPPVMWIIILFIDGDYVACAATKWEGNYVFDKELNRMWCQPTQLNHTESKSNLQHEYRRLITISQSQNQPPDQTVELTQTSTSAPEESAPPSISAIVQNPTTRDAPEESTPLTYL
ncbi:hypothetical protein E1301_Tti012829 [Triplophysa tibetana]|uniref:Uncharacterized protein n=1 Tax=Triplophysa tibetana TaxID=1572043 RepID=A0A5A9NPP4_9TELE|nr:hypothetical protein E1301_Tti012829 [Triplophysa tibetana]